MGLKKASKYTSISEIRRACWLIFFKKFCFNLALIFLREKIINFYLKFRGSSEYMNIEKNSGQKNLLFISVGKNQNHDGNVSNCFKTSLS